MFAWFHKGEFQAMRQDQRDKDYVALTSKALGQDQRDVEIYIAPPIPNRQSFYFDGQKRLVLEASREVVKVDGKDQTVITWMEPIVLQKFYPAPQ